MMQSDSLPMVGKIYYKVPLRLASPLIVGCGADENSDVDVLREEPSGEPLIPATSIVGVLRACLEKDIVPCDHKDLLGKDVKLKEITNCACCQFRLLFGDRDTTGVQSALQCEDIVLTGYHIAARDGVEIDHETQTAVAERKYNFEIVERPIPDSTQPTQGDNPQEVFTLLFEITLRAPQDVEMTRAMIEKGIRALSSGEIRLGAKTNKGFGRFERAGDVEWKYLDFKKNGDDVWAWLSNDVAMEKLEGFEKKETEPESTVRKDDYFQIDAHFQIKSALMIRSYPAIADAPDTVYITQSGKPVLPGTSVMGAVRHRARKILQTRWDKEVVEKRLNQLFGFVKTSKKKNETTAKAQRGKVRVEEHLIKQNPVKMVQTRIKIDRFTGGTVAGALLEEMPLWRINDKAPVHISITIPEGCDDWEACLLLLVLKDLWTGDLAIGGTKSVGRGVLLGQSAHVAWGKDDYDLEADGEGVIKETEQFKALNIKFTNEWKKD